VHGRQSRAHDKSQKIQSDLAKSGGLDKDSNPVLMQGQGSRKLENIADLDARGFLEVQPGKEAVFGDELLSTYTTGTVSLSTTTKTVTGSGTTWVTPVVAYTAAPDRVGAWDNPGAFWAWTAGTSTLSAICRIWVRPDYYEHVQPDDRKEVHSLIHVDIQRIFSNHHMWRMVCRDVRLGTEWSANVHVHSFRHDGIKSPSPGVSSNVDTGGVHRQGSSISGVPGRYFRSRRQ